MKGNGDSFLLMIVMTFFLVLSTQVYGDEDFTQEEGLKYQVQIGRKIDAAIDKTAIQMIRIEFLFQGKTAVVQYGGGEYYVLGKSNANKKIVALNDDDHDLISDALLKADLSEDDEQNKNPLSKVVYNALNLLNAWPHKMPLFLRQDSQIHMAAIRGNQVVEMDKKEVIARDSDRARMYAFGKLDKKFLTLPKIEPGWTFGGSAEKQTEFMALSWDSLCHLMGQLHNGKYIRKVTWSGYKYKSFERVVNSGSCFGRCGAGCLNDGNKYTQDCFNHDGCVDAQGLLDWRCDIMFTWCVDDYLTAPEC